uniref:RAS, guanyl releasing protein 2 n=1 Tax=Mus musculus TaxID=10090 RepID=D3YZP1_MOUSE
MTSTLDLDKGCTVEELLRGCIEAFAGFETAPLLSAIPEGQLQFSTDENVSLGQVLDLSLPSRVRLEPRAG